MHDSPSSDSLVPSGAASAALLASGAVSAPLLDRQLCFALYSASLAMTRLYKPLLADLGLTYPQYLVLLALWQHDALSVGALGREVQLDSGTLTPLLKRLEAAGVLTRRRDAADERRVRLHLTPAGQALRQRAAVLAERMACATACAPDELAALTRRVQALRDVLLASSPDLPDRAAA